MRHPGGILPIQHLNGKDATDVIKAFHPAYVLNKIKVFKIGEYHDDRVDSGVDTGESLSEGSEGGYESDGGRNASDGVIVNGKKRGMEE